MSKVKLSVLVFALVLLVTGAVGAVSNDTYVDIDMGNIDSLDPHYQYDNASAEITTNVYENLIMFKDGTVTEFEPLLATEVPSLENGLIKDGGRTYIFPIREGVIFHNGATLTPEDVKYSFLRGLIQDRSGGPMWMLFEPLYGVGSSLATISAEVVGVEDPSELTPEQSEQVYAYLEKAIEIDGNNVVFNLPDPYPPFLSIIVHNNGVGAILDKEWTIAQGGWDGSPTTIAEYYNPEKEEDPLYDKMNGTGPYQLKEWVNGERTVLSAFNGYWREPARIKTVIIKSVEEWSTRKLYLQRGDADSVYVDLQYLDQVRNMDGVKVVEDLARLSSTNGLMNFDIVTEGNPDVHSGKLDGKGIPADFFADIHVRKAFNYSMPYDTFIDQVAMGMGQQVRGPIIDPFLGYDPESPVYEFDLAKAEAEFRKAFDGELWEKGFEITILYNSGNEVRKAAVDMIKHYVEQINPKFKVNVRGVQWATYLDNLVAGKFTLGFIGWGASYADPHYFAVPFLRNDGTFSGFKGESFKEWAKENTDPLIAEAVSTADPEERAELYAKLQQIAYDEALDIYLYQPTGHYVFRDNVKGFVYDPINEPNLNFYDLYKE
ncbi:MAG: ABC transporter substrate-binding protein [Halanaerobiales bacterium]